MKLSTFKVIAMILLCIPMPMHAQFTMLEEKSPTFGPLEEQESEWEKEMNSNKEIGHSSFSSSRTTSSFSSSSSPRHKGTYTRSGQSLCINTGEYTSDIGDFTFEAEFYDDYIIVAGSKCKYSYTKADGRKVYYSGIANSSSFWIVDANYNMSYETNLPTPGVGMLTFINTVSKGETTMPHQNVGGNYTGGNYNSNTSSGSRSTSTRSTTQPTRHTCPLCHGRGTIVRTSTIATYGKDTQRYCSTCGRNYWTSSGHSHVTCSQCHGKGYFETR